MSFAAGCDFKSKEQAEKALGGLVDMRNQVMHLVRPALERMGEVRNLAERVHRARDTLQRLDEQEVSQRQASNNGETARSTKVE